MPQNLRQFRRLFEGELTITINITIIMTIKRSFLVVKNRPNNGSIERYADVSRKIMTAILIR